MTSGTKLKFYEKTHKYKLGKKELTSVTKFLSQFFSPFDAKAVARKLAKFPVNRVAKKGVRHWLKEWKEASAHGTRVHNGIESFIKGKKISEIKTESERDISKLTQGIAFIELNCKKAEKIPEMQLYSEDHLLAGTADLVVFNGNEVTIIDWKTNKAITKVPYNKKAKCKEPIDRLPDATYYKYALQLSVYGKILEEQGYKVKELQLVHLKEDSFTVHTVDYNEYKQDVERLFEWQRKKNQQ